MLLVMANGLVSPETGFGIGTCVKHLIVSGGNLVIRIALIMRQTTCCHQGGRRHITESVNDSCLAFPGIFLIILYKAFSHFGCEN